MESKSKELTQLGALKEYYFMVTGLFFLGIIVLFTLLFLGCYCLNTEREFLFPLDNTVRIIIGAILVPLSMIAIYLLPCYSAPRLGQIHDLVKLQESREKLLT